MTDSELKLRLLLMSINGGHGYDHDSIHVRLAVDRLYRKGVLVMAMDTGEFRLSSYGEEILEKLGEHQC